MKCERCGPCFEVETIPKKEMKYAMKLKLNWFTKLINKAFHFVGKKWAQLHISYLEHVNFLNNNSKKR